MLNVFVHVKVSLQVALLTFCRDMLVLVTAGNAARQMRTALQMRTARCVRGALSLFLFLYRLTF